MTMHKLDPFSYKAPPLFDATAESIIAETRALVKNTAAVGRKIANEIRPEEANFENTILPIVENENARTEKDNHLRFYASTSPVQEIRDASNAAVTLFNDAETEFFSQKDLFHLVDLVLTKIKQKSSSSIDSQSLLCLSKLHQNFLVNGCAIEDDIVRAGFVSKKNRINEVAKECRKNMAAESTGLWLTVDELAGVAPSHVKRLKEGTGEHEGYVWLPTKVPSTEPVLRDATHEATRKKVFYAIANRMPQNVPLFREMTLLRDETARLLGWPNHFAFKTSQKMMSNPKAVSNMLSEVREALMPIGQDLAATLLSLKRDEAITRDGPVTDPKLFLWDRVYFKQQLPGQQRLSDAAASEYFELSTTFHKLLAIYEHLFGVRLVPVDTQARENLDKKLIWHEDVTMFSAWDVDGDEPQFLGYSYFDLFPREGKYTHAGQYTLQRRYQRLDGTWFDPCSCLVMNYMKPTDGKPTLLSLNSVRSLFHELGHMYHCLLSRSRYARLHSTDTDFVETPSMMLEHFFWDASIIHDVSYHYSHISPEMRQVWLSSLSDGQTDNVRREIPRQLSREQATDLAQSNSSTNIFSSLNNLAFATYDMLIHSPVSHEALEKTNLCELFNKTRVDILQASGGESLGEGWEYGQGQSVFRAIQGKYDAGYYAYVLGRIFALDIFESGFSQDLMNRDNARRYRDMVLCKGGSQSEMKTLTDFLGHEPSIMPFLNWLKG